MSVRLNESGDVVRVREVEEVIDRGELQARVDEAQARVDQATADLQEAQAEAEVATAELSEAQQNLNEYDAVAPAPAEEAPVEEPVEEPAPEVHEPVVEGEDVVPPEAQF